MNLSSIFKSYSEKNWKPILMLILSFGLFLITYLFHFSRLAQYVSCSIVYIVVFSIIVSIVIKLINKKWVKALLLFFISFSILVIFYLFFILTTAVNPSPFSETIIYKRTVYEFDYKFNPIKVSFGSDSIELNKWFRILNIENGNMRIVQIINKEKKPIFSLPYAVLGSTHSTIYSLQIDKKRYLWIEDNFGTTVIDIDSMQLIKTKSPTRKLDIILGNGASIGVENKVSDSYIRKQLSLDKFSKIKFYNDISLDE